MTNVVIDTNVIVSAMLSPDGVPATLIAPVTDGSGGF